MTDPVTQQAPKTPKTPKTVLLIGATGALGNLIAHELKRRGATLRLLVRDASRAKLAPEIAEYAESIVGDEPEIFDGVDTVVSAVQGATKTIVNDQLRWLRAARNAGVNRFMPSDYSMDLFALEDGDNIHSDFRREFARRAEEERGDVEIVHLLNGGFLDLGVLFGFLGMIDLERGTVQLWGDGTEPMEFTTFADTAAFIAAAAVADGPLPEKLFVAGDRVTVHELAALLQEGLGRPFSVVDNGPFESLTETIDELTADQGTRMRAVPYQYWRAMISGKGALGALENARFPDVQPQRVRDYVAKIADGTATSPYFA